MGRSSRAAQRDALCPKTVKEPDCGDGAPAATFSRSAAPVRGARCAKMSPRIIPLDTPAAMDDWRSYDAIAETYDRIWAPRLETVAGHLLALSSPAEGARL